MSKLFFADQRLLWVFVPLYLMWCLAWYLKPKLVAQGGPALRFSSLSRIRLLRGSNRIVERRLVLGLRLLTVLLLGIAMARPQTGRSLTQVTSDGVDIVLAIDTSGSMQALDLDATQAIADRRNRLEVARDVVKEFIKKRDTDQIGMVVFGGEAFTQCPRTLDHGILATFLERIEIGMAGDATAIGLAIGTAVKRLKDSEAKSKVIILLTDGRSNAGSLGPRKAAEVAKAMGVKIYSIGVGSRGEAPFVVDSIFGQRVVYQDVDLDEQMLTEIAATTGGEYFRAEDADALAGIYERIDQLEKTEIKMKQYMEYNEQFRWFVIPAIVLTLLEMLLLGTRYRKIP